MCIIQQQFNEAITIEKQIWYKSMAAAAILQRKTDRERECMVDKVRIKKKKTNEKFNNKKHQMLWATSCDHPRIRHWLVGCCFFIFEKRNTLKYLACACLTFQLD